MIHDYTALWPGSDKNKRHIDHIEKILIHRVWLPIGYPSPLTFLNEYRRTDKGSAGASTGGNKPYSFLLPPLGEIWQLAAVSERTAHAFNFNSKSIGVAVWGDFREGKGQPSQAQSDSLIYLCASLCAMLGLDERAIEGHTESPGRSAYVKKVCPGPLLSLPTIRECVRVKLAGLPRGAIPEGLVI